MPSLSHRFVARAAWLMPALLFLLALHQANVAYDLHRTLTEGRPAQAQVTQVHQENRVDVTYDYVSLRVTLADGQTIEREKMSLPHTLITPIEGKQTVEVRVLPGADQEIVIAEIASAQWRIAAINAAMSGVAALLFAAGVFAWNAYLKHHGDPAEQQIKDREEEHPAGQVARQE